MAVQGPQPSDRPSLAMAELETRDVRRRAVHAAWVAGLALVALVAIVAIAVLALPSAQKGQNIIAIASASFGVIGAIVGAYFGVSSANRAAEIVRTGPTGPARARRTSESAGS